MWCIENTVKLLFDTPSQAVSERVLFDTYTGNGMREAVIIQEAVIGVHGRPVWGNSLSYVGQVPPRKSPPDFGPRIFSRRITSRLPSVT